MSRNLCPLYIVDDEVPVLESIGFYVMKVMVIASMSIQTGKISYRV